MTQMAWFDPQDTFAASTQAYLNADARAGVSVSGKPSYTIAQAANQLLRGEPGWSSALGQPFTVTYAYRASAPASMPSDTTGFQRFNVAQIHQTELALKAWSDVANIRFVRVGAGVSGDAAYSNSASILLGDYTSGEAGSAAFTYFPGSTASSAVDGDVWVNVSLTYNSSPTVGNYGGLVLVHELGHAIGLAHPSDYDASANSTLSYSSDASYYEDDRQYSVMSYFAETNTGANFGGVYAASPMLDDIAAAQLAYGANMNTRTGDTIYGFHSNADAPWFIADSSDDKLAFAVWDAGGNDTFDFSGYGQNQLINLRPGFFSNIGGLTGNVAVAANVTIENASGGAGADTIIGNDVSNILSGGAGDDALQGGKGNDWLDGGPGADTAAYAGFASKFSISYYEGAYHVRDLSLGSPEGVDTALNIETLSFGGWTVAAGRTLLPVKAGLGDFDGDGRADILWRYQPNGVTSVWQMDGSQRIGGGFTDSGAGNTWTIVGSGDFGGDGKADILWRDYTSGATAIWSQNGVHTLSAGLASSQPGPDWYVAGIADYSGDGKADVLWRNFGSSSTVIWTMNGATVVSASGTEPYAPGEWSVAGAGDFNGDGKADILWRNQIDGATAIWLMAGPHLIGNGYTSLAAPTPWVVAGTGDFNGDGKADILWRNDLNQMSSVWEMSGLDSIGGGIANAVAPNGWVFA
jgi:hypothetical protein